MRLNYSSTLFYFLRNQLIKKRKGNQVWFYFFKLQLLEEREFQFLFSKVNEPYYRSTGAYALRKL